MRRLLRCLIGCAIVAAAVFLSARPASAIPAFARKYQLSCSTCHAPFPRLKPYGEEFAARGFRMPPAEEPPRATYDVGDPLLKLPRDLPLAVRVEGFAAYRQDADAETASEFPSAFKILSGGAITGSLSYYLYFIIEDGEVVGLEDAFVQYNGLFKGPVDLVFGQFQVSDPLFKRELRLERFDYEIFKTQIGDALVNLSYERGVVFPWHAPGKVEVALEVVNGNGIDDPSHTFDRDNCKNLALRVARQFGPVRVGAFGYTGKERGDNGLSNKTTYLGPDLVLDLGKKWQVNLEYLERRDDDPFFCGDDPGSPCLFDPNSPAYGLFKPGEDFVTRGGFAEIHFFPKGQDGRWALSALYSRVDSDDPAAESETASLTMNYLLARNVRLLVEPGRDLQANVNVGSIGLVIAF